MTNPADFAPTQWKRKKSQFEVTLPSGQKCLCRSVTMEDILELGILDVMDTFTGQLLAEPESKEADQSVSATFEMLKDKERRDKFLGAINKLIPKAVVLPRVHEDPFPGYEKEEDKVYVSDIELQDKMEIFAKTFGGWGDASTFRPESEKPLGSVAES